ncbi:MAG: winged helix-turn-helix transcriptional regulator [Deltaproteobacteria bacterium]|nr:winged helix-turn-helix transcriptional regulator [Deltaproteobacteria bacterium]
MPLPPGAARRATVPSSSGFHHHPFQCIYISVDASLQALADPRRRAIVELLRSGEQPVSDLVAKLPIAQSGVSRHLRILRETGLVTVRAAGQKRFYSLRPEPFEELSDWLEEMRAVWEHRLDNFETELERRMAARTEHE